MEADIRKKIQIGFIILFVLIGIRLGWIWKERHDSGIIRPVENRIATPSDAYVVPPKLHAYDLASAKQGLEGKNIWVAAGNIMKYYPVHGGAPDMAHSAGLLPPMDELHITRVIEVRGPSGLIKQGNVTIHTNGDRQVAAEFTHAGSDATFAVPIAAVSDGSYDFNVDDSFFLADPHNLYKHWPPPVWQAIDQHQVIAGMNELQTGLALGPGQVVNGAAADYGNRTLQYKFSGKTFTVTFRGDKATEIQS